MLGGAFCGGCWFFVLFAADLSFTALWAYIQTSCAFVGFEAGISICIFLIVGTWHFVSGLCNLCDLEGGCVCVGFGINGCCLS